MIQISSMTGHPQHAYMVPTSGSPRRGAGSNFWKVRLMSSLTSMMAARLPEDVGAEVRRNRFKQCAKSNRHLREWCPGGDSQPGHYAS